MEDRVDRRFKEWRDEEGMIREQLRRDLERALRRGEDRMREEMEKWMKVAGGREKVGLGIW